MSDTGDGREGPQSHGDWREERRRERKMRRDGHGWGGPWIGGVILIAIGLIFLMQNFGYVLPKNWWAVFILIPAVGSLMAAYRTYENNGRQASGGVIGPAIAGLAFVLLAIALFLGIDWGAFWPVILILIGIGIMARTYWQR